MSFKLQPGEQGILIAIGTLFIGILAVLVYLAIKNRGRAEKIPTGSAKKLNSGSEAGLTPPSGPSRNRRTLERIREIYSGQPISEIERFHVSL